jgi:CubicO group peptidase (beta-lactamase class C family)
MNPRPAIALGLVLVFACSPDDIPGWMEHHEVPGASLAVIRDFELEQVVAHGVRSLAGNEPVTTDTLFQAASLSKSVSAVGLLCLVQDGVVSLDTDVNDYLTSWQIPDYPWQATEKVTIRRLLSHTAGTTVSGFRGYRYSEPVPTLPQILNGEPPANSDPVVVTLIPGTQYRYSGGGYVALTLLVEDVTGKSFPEFIAERVLEPIGMGASTYEQPIPEGLRDTVPTGYYANGRAVPGGHHIYPEMAAGGLWTTASDLARFLIELQLSLRGESNRVLTRENAELMVTEVMRDYSFGLNLWNRDGEHYFGHPGANDGFRSKMVAHRSAGYGVVILTNSDRGSDLYDDVIDLIADEQSWAGY